MNKLLVICGPTATGKTSLGFQIAEKFNGELVSADSRQVYKGLDIGTGKDIPDNSKFKLSPMTWNGKKIGYYEIGGVKIWGYDFVSAKEEFSISHFSALGREIIHYIKMWDPYKLPILVGGSGLYIQSLTSDIQTINVPTNNKLRTSLEDKESRELFEILRQLNAVKADSMNNSDKNNPRRLVRAIEIEKYLKQSGKNLITDYKNRDFKVLYIGLTAPKEIIADKIEQRVHKRIEDGIENEIKKLLKSGISWNMQSMNTLGYKEWKEYFEGKITKEDVVKRWILDEQKYAKRQMTWFKKDKRINWFDITREGWKEEVAKTVRKWENK